MIVRMDQMKRKLLKVLKFPKDNKQFSSNNQKGSHPRQLRATKLLVVVLWFVMTTTIFRYLLRTMCGESLTPSDPKWHDLQ